MWEDFPTDLNIYAVSAANPTESSYGYHLFELIIYLY